MLALLFLLDNVSHVYANHTIKNKSFNYLKISLLFSFVEGVHVCCMSDAIHLADRLLGNCSAASILQHAKTPVK